MLTLTHIEKLADSASLARGRDYFQRGLVVSATTRADGTVDGIVNGEHSYRVKLGARSWSCTCPVGSRGDFCKHCVAVALAVAANSQLADAPPTSGGASADLDNTGSDAPSGDNVVETLPAARTRILGMFRTRHELVRWDAVSEYVAIASLGEHELRAAAVSWGPAKTIPVVEKAIAVVVKVLQRADDSNGEIGELVGDLMALHAELYALAPPAPKKLVDWLINFEFDGSQDFFTPDIADYTAALGVTGANLLLDRLDALEAELPPLTGEWDSARFARHNISHYRERLAVALGDPAGVIASFGELTRSYRMHELAKALVEVGAVDQAVDTAERGTLLETGWQAERCGQYWAELLHEHRSREAELDARQRVFDRWPTSVNALELAATAGPGWDARAEAAFTKLEKAHPRELINSLLALGLVDRAWQDALRLTTDPVLWTQLVAAREKSDPASVVPVLLILINGDLKVSDARNYKSAVKRLKQLKKALVATGHGDDFAGIVADLREANRRRPRLLDELGRVGM